MQINWKKKEKDILGIVFVRSKKSKSKSGRENA